MAQPPPLPPRRPSHTPSPPEIVEQPISSSSSYPFPPPLPPRKPPPDPLLVNNDSQTNDIVVDQIPLSTPTLAVTPATPPEFQTGTQPSSPSLSQNSAQLASSSHVEFANTVKTSSVTPQSDNAFTTITPPRLPPRKPQRKSSSVDLTKIVNVPPTWFLLTALLMILAYMRVSLPLLLLAAVGSTLYVKDRLQGSTDRKTERVDDLPVNLSVGNDKIAVDWVNHALYALFPLISTDILAPFVDLLEDALIEQVPPVVTSVRLTSPSLGSQPLLLTSLRPMSDQEWFATISAAQNKRRQKQKETGNSRTHQRSKSSISKSTKHNRTASTSSAPPALSMSRSRSSSSVGSAISADFDDVTRETQKRRKRDRILQNVSRHRSAKSPGGEDSGFSHGDRQTEDGQRDIGGSGETDLDDDDPNAGQYVNYQVGFEYKRSDTSKKKGWGLHILAYFGWGIKGVGNSEIPVYIDMLSIKGILNLRLLLSATPPFIRTGTFSLPSLPDFDISAQPLKRGAFNAMELPGMKTYVQKSIAEVAEAFVRPKSYTLDVERLLLGREASVRTNHVGILHIFIHGADDLPKSDTMGSCDPYVSISYSKFHKPLFSTRTIGNTRNPRWEEQAFILVAADAIEAGERVRLRCCDSDRFSADDAVGVVEVDLAELVDGPRGKFDRRQDELQADRPGMKSSGYLNWSVRFCPLWEMSEKSLEKATKAKREYQNLQNVHEPKETMIPWWIDYLASWIPDPEDWATQRAQKRKETIAWFTGEKEKDELEAEAPPPDDYPSGILQFHIHQCNDLQVESLAGTYSSSFSSRKSAAGGRPALNDEIDKTPTENPEPPSPYVEVYINDQLVYRSRTKQLNPMPYFNAVSERFVRDWTKGKVVFVVRDERNREHDPILGLVSIPLKDAFSTRSQITRWFPLVAGLGWGRIRLSLLFKPVDIHLPRGIATYELATLRLNSLSMDISDNLRSGEKGFGIMIETESDKYELSASGAPSPSPWPASSGEMGTGSSPYNSPSRKSISTSRLSFGSPSTSTEIGWSELEWDLSSSEIRLAIRYRHSCSLVISIIARTGVLKKKKILGLAVLYLGEFPDGELISKKDIPIFVGEVDEVMGASEQWRLTHQTSSNETNMPPLTPSPRDMVRARSSSTASKRSNRTIPTELEPIGFIHLSFTLYQGISKSHKRLAKRDMRFGKAYEVWEAAREVEHGLDKMGVRDELRQGTKELVEDTDTDSDTDSDSEDSDTESEQEEGGNEVVNLAKRSKGNARRKKFDASKNGSGSGQRGNTGQPEIDELDGEESHTSTGWRAHSRALHKRHKGVFQLKIARTGRYVKDAIQAKMYTAAQKRGDGLIGNDRMRGEGILIEKEGVSKL